MTVIPVKWLPGILLFTGIYVIFWEGAILQGIWLPT